jgi:hypothetical protein
LLGSKIRRIHGGLNEILRMHWRTCKTAKHCELPGVSHRISERPLQESLFRGVLEFSADRKMLSQVLKHRVKAHDLSAQVR